MIIIAHRANLYGPSPLTENSIESVQDALALGFCVEVDVWMHEKAMWLGHDEPQYKISDTSWLQYERVWCHAKNLECAEALKAMGCHFFWHENDTMTLTSKGFFWTYPGKKLGKNSIAVMPEISFDKENFAEIAGVCTDWPLRYVGHEI